MPTIYFILHRHTFKDSTLLSSQLFSVLVTNSQIEILFLLKQAKMKNTNSRDKSYLWYTVYSEEANQMNSLL